MQLEMAGKSDVGRQRKRNEDNFIILEQFQLAVVADGMGGHIDGNIASSIAVDTIQQQYQQYYESLMKEWSPDEIASRQEKFLSSGIQEANKNIYARNLPGNVAYGGMGTTLVALQIHSNYAITAWVGDSRIYLLRNQKLSQLTQDHSLVEELVHYDFPVQDIALTKFKNIITRALGMTESVLIDISSHTIFPNDIFLLCTDGLTDSLNNEEITKILTEHQNNIKYAVEVLIEESNKQGGADNITAALVKICE